MANGKLSLEEVRDRAVRHAERAEELVSGTMPHGPDFNALASAQVHAVLSQSYSTMLVADRAVFGPREPVEIESDLDLLTDVR